MTPLAAFLAELARRDIRLAVDGGKLRVDAPDGALTADLQAELRARKAELVAYLAEFAAPAAPTDDEALRAPRDAPLPLADGQRRLYGLAQLKPDSTVYNISTVFRLAGPLDLDALDGSLTALAQRHEALRTVFVEPVRGAPEQQVQPPTAMRAARADLRAALQGQDAEARDAAIRRRLQDDARVPFDLARGPLWRTLVLRTGDDEHVLAFTMHHLVFDGRSKPVFLRELAQAYRAIRSGAAPAWPALPVQYADFAWWQRRRAEAAEAAGQLDYWTQQLGGTPAELALPADRPRPPRPVEGAASRSFALPPALAQAVRTYARQAQASEYIVLLAAFCALLNRYTGQEDLIVCSPVAARDRAEFEDLIGYLNTIVVVRADLAGDPDFGALAGRLRRTVLDAWQNQHVPLQKLAELPALARVALTRAMFSFQDTSSRVLDLPGVAATPLELRKDAPDFDLALYMEAEGDGQLGGVLEYNADLFAAATIDALVANFTRLIATLTGDPHRRLSSLPAFADDAAVAAKLAAHPQIDAAVVGRRPGHAGPVAWVVLNEDDIPRLDAIRAHLRAAFPEYRVPQAFVTVDRMPLLPDGSVDRAALPAPAAGARGERAYVAPRTPLESTLADVWQRVLWLDTPVGVTESFVDLGGHSLLSAQLIVEVEQVLGRPLPEQALAELGTIEDMARIVEADLSTRAAAINETGGDTMPEVLHRLRRYTASWIGTRVDPSSVLVGLNVGGRLTPLIWVLQRYQELTQLARYLGPERPVYGLRSARRVLERTPDNLARLASHYADEILAARPEGPYAVGGNCGATQVALPLAQELKARGCDVALLFMHEKFIAQPYAGRVALLFGAQSDRNPFKQYADPAHGWRKHYRGPVTVDIVSGAHAEFFVEPNVQVLTAAIRRRMEELDVRAPPAGAFPPGDGLLPLPAGAHRARFTVRPPAPVRPGERFRLDVEVRNVSASPWPAGERSGIALVNRWLDPKRRPVVWLDGRTPLPAAVAAGAAINLELVVTAPATPGSWLLVFDLVEEGVTTFSSVSSEAGAVAVVVDGGPAVRG